MRTIVRRATLALDSDLEPDSALLERAAEGAACLGDLRLADRLAKAAINAGAGAEAYFVRAHALSWLSSGVEADAVLSDVPPSGLDSSDDGRQAFLRATNYLWTLADPDRAKESIDGANTDHAHRQVVASEHSRSSMPPRWECLTKQSPALKILSWKTFPNSLVPSPRGH